jgi:uroporphyrinogen-III decarboxylase
MPKGGYFFDGIQRAEPFDEGDLDPVRDYGEQFTIYSDEDARWIENEAKRLYEETDCALVGLVANGSFGDAGALHGGFLKKVRGIRAMDDWLAAHLMYPEYIEGLFAYQLEVFLKNLNIYRQAVGDRIDVIYTQGTDFGMQTGELISPDLYRALYKQPIKAYCDWIHKNTNWKVMIHTCGSIVNLFDELSETGIDILNPVQCSAKGMDPRMIKEKHGHQFIFWGGGIDTQKTLPFGSAEDVWQEVTERLKIFGSGGGFVFNTTHNIVGGTPVDNLLVMYDTVAKNRAYFPG